MTDTLFPWIDLAGRLDKIAGDIALAPHLISGPDGEWKIDNLEGVQIHVNEAMSFCKSCGSLLVQLLKAAGAGRDGEGPGLYPAGWPEEDGCLHCKICGSVLEYWLTDFGVQAEKEHFADDEPSFPLSREEAYHLARIADTEQAGDGFRLRLQGWLERHDEAAAGEGR